MIEQQQQILNSIMIANCSKYFSQQHHHQATQSSSLVTKNSVSDSLKIMSNPGATNSQAAASGMSFSATAAAAVIAPDSPQPAVANKMGSRRIFSPHFKIQVLESYRNDNDCKGNQRATARKYGIHRRQIQKWLQCESALRTSVSSGSSPSNSPPMGKPVDPNNNSGKRSLNGAKSETAPLMLSTSSAQARHSVDSAAARLAESDDCERSATHTQKTAMEFFSPTTSLIINGGAASGGPGDGGRKIGSMNEAAVPIKPEFCFTSTSPSPHPSAIGRSGAVDMPSTAAAAMFKHQHQQAAPEEDAPHHSLLSAMPALPPFISTIYGPQSLLGFPCAFPFEFAPTMPRQPLLSPIDLSVGNAERRGAGDLFRRSPLIQVDDARVPSQSAEERTSPATVSASEASPAAPMDLSCSRKRKSSSVAAEPVKPPKLFKPYLLDEQEEEEELKVVDDDEEEEEDRAAAPAKEDPFLDTDLAVLKDKLGHRFEYPTAVYPASHQYSPAYEGQLYYSHENLTLYPSPRQCHSAESSPVHHPSRPASISSSDSAFGSYHPSSPASSVRSSPPVFSPANWGPQELRARIMGSAF